MFQQIFRSFLFIIGSVSLSWGQSDAYELVDIFTIEDGLSHNYVTCLKKYDISLVVAGTQNGVHIYDGYDFQLFNSKTPPPFTLNDDKINSMEISRDGYFWISSTNGINKINPFKGENELYFNKGNLEYPPLKSETISNTLLAATPNGTMWIVNNGIICRIINGKIKQYFPEKFNDVTKIITDEYNNIFALTNQTLICLDAMGKLVFEINGFSSSLYGLQQMNEMSNLFKTPNGEIIIEDFLNNRYFKIDVSERIEDLTVENHWLPKFFKEITQQAESFNIKTLQIFDFLEPDEGLIWVATNFGLAKVLVKQKFFKTIPELDGISCRNLHLGEDGLLYGGTYAPSQFFIYNPKNKNLQWIEKNRDARHMIPLNQDSLLVLADREEVRIFSKSQRKVLVEKKAPTKSRFQIAVKDNDNTIWFGGDQNFFQSNLTAPLSFTSADVPEGDIISKNLVRDICQYSDSTFLLATDNGMINYHKRKGTSTIYNTNSPPPQKLLHDVIGQFILDKKGNVWVATDGGLNYFDIKNEKVLKEYSTKNGLPNNIIYSMVMENDSILWIGTSNGLSRFDINKGMFSNYFKKDGLADNEFNSNSFAKTTDEKIFMGGIKGITIIDPVALQPRQKAFTHFIASYRKYNSSTGAINSFFLNPNQIKPIRLNPEELYLEIYFVNSDFTNPSRNTFSHYLEGFENDWLPYSNQNSTVYSNLPAGEYVFKLKSKNANGKESDFVFEFPIVVEQSFYKSWWFIGLVITILILGVLWFNRMKLAQERRITRMRNRMASDLHDEVSNSLNNIRIIAKETNFSDKEKMKTDFHRIQKMSNEAIEHVEDAIWSIDKSYGKASDLFFKMEDYVDDVLRAKNIPVQFVREGLNDNAQLGFLYRRNMLLIFKEAISNIVKHTKPLRVDILYKKTDEAYLMRITNTFEERIDSEYSTGKGLIGMQQRAEAMGATMKFIKEENRFEVLMEKKFKKK